jgi:transposase
LNREQIVALKVLKEKGQANTATAKVLGVTEGAVRYHLRRQAAGAQDGRVKPFLLERLGLTEAVQMWWMAEEKSREEAGEKRPPSAEELHEYLWEEHEYDGSYKAVLRYVRAKFPRPKIRPYRRMETPPGAQSQTDWLELAIDIGDQDGPTWLYGLVIKLSHSRRKVVIWSRQKDQLAWLHCHNEAFKRLGGIAAINRVDNEKTAISKGAGPWGEVNPVYQAYARTMGFHVNACEAYCPEQKGKVEKGVREIKELALSRHRFTSLDELQTYTDRRLEEEARRRICPVTGKSVFATWQDELTLLRSLPARLPAPFDLVQECQVHKDCTIRFEGHTYAVPFAYVGKRVEVRGESGTVQVVDRRTGQALVKYPRHTEALLQIDPRCYEGEATAEVMKPKPLGRLSRRLMELAAEPVQHRAIDYYVKVAEVLR